MSVTMIGMRILSGLLIVALLVTGCSKGTSGCQAVPVDDERSMIMAFATSRGITAIRHTSGFYYEIENPGSTNRPGQLSQVYVKYKGTFFDGTVFDSQTNPGLTGFQLSSLIEGWKIGIPLIGKGGKIKLIVPSALAYSCQGESRGETPIPPNTPLYFEIELVDFL